MPAEHAVDIPVDDGGRQSEGKAADGSRRIVSDALQCLDTLQRGGEAALCHHLLGGSMQVTCPAVVAQALPLPQHLVLRGRRQCLHCRPPPHEALPVGPSLFDARLLEDDFRQPDGIRILCLTPRQFPAVFAKPSKQGHGEVTHCSVTFWLQNYKININYQLSIINYFVSLHRHNIE